MKKATRIILEFDKCLHKTGLAYLVLVNDRELWLPKSQCKKMSINKKLGGHVSIPVWLADKLSIPVTEKNLDVSVKTHVPKKVKKMKHAYDKSLFK